MSDPIVNLKPRSAALTSVVEFKKRVFEGFLLNPETATKFGHFTDFKDEDWRLLLSDARNALLEHDEISLIPVTRENGKFNPVVDIDFAMGKKRPSSIHKGSLPEETESAISGLPPSIMYALKL